MTGFGLPQFLITCNCSLSGGDLPETRHRQMMLLHYWKNPWSLQLGLKACVVTLSPVICTCAVEKGTTVTLMLFAAADISISFLLKQSYSTSQRIALFSFSLSLLSLSSLSLSELLFYEIFGELGLQSFKTIDIGRTKGKRPFMHFLNNRFRD